MILLSMRDTNMCKVIAKMVLGLLLAAIVFVGASNVAVADGDCAASDPNTVAAE
jgi:hypothetical protein